MCPSESQKSQEEPFSAVLCPSLNEEMSSSDKTALL